MFRAQLQVNEQLNLFLKRSLQEARDRKLLKGQVLAQAVDTRPIFGRGAVEDTYNLIGHAMHTLVRALCAKSGASPAAFATKHGMQRLDAPSLKGAIDIDWSDECARDVALSQLVTDARKLLGLVTGDDKKIENAAILLKQILLQDVDETKDPDDDSDQATLKKGTARGRAPSVTDSQQRHGRKSAAKRFTGHKASVSADLETGLILAVDVLAGDAPDATDVIELTKQAEENSQAAVTQTFGDCAYGSGATRHQFEEAGRELLAKVPAEPKGKLFSKSAFCIQLPQERLIQRAREFQATPEGRQSLRKRLVVENSLARLAKLGIGQARVFGRQKTRFQLVMAATVANLRRTWNYAGLQPA